MDHINSKTLISLFFMYRNVLAVCVIFGNCLFVSPSWGHDYNAHAPTKIALPDSFVDFRNNLEIVLDTKDVAGVRQFLAEDITFGFGGSSGPDQFIIDIGLDEPNGEGWALLTYLISADVAKIDLDQAEAYMLPYTSEDWPEIDDPSSVVIGNAETKLRAAPSDDGRIASTLKYPILQIKSEIRNGEWLEVEASNGLWGYIPEMEVASYLGYRMMIENKAENNDAKWLISFVGAGD